MTAVELALPDLMRTDVRVQRIVLQSNLSHSQAAREVQALGYRTTESSIRRARKSGRKTYLILSDMQCDLQDDSFLERVYTLAKDLEPDGIYSVGDENDATTVGRWVQGLPEEHDPDSLQRQVDVTYRWHKRFSDLPSVEDFQIAYSNHGHRFGQSLRSRVPGWKDMRVVQYSHIMREAAWHHGDEELPIKYDVPIITAIPGVVLGHGDQWALSSKSQYTQMSAVAQKLGRSVIAGHTHRPLLSTVSYLDEAGEQQSRFILNVGHSMDVNKATYMNVDRGRTPEWGQAVGVVTTDGTSTLPELVMDVNQQMFFRGRIY